MSIEQFWHSQKAEIQALARQGWGQPEELTHAELLQQTCLYEGLLREGIEHGLKFRHVRRQAAAPL